MSITINFNLPAATAQRHLGNTARLMQRDVERLSSGLRINSAKDDAAGLAISTKLRAQAQGMNRAWRNVQDATSFLQTAEGGLSQLSDILARVRELSVQAANGVYSTQDKQQIQGEIDQAVAEIDRIGQTTQFAGRKVLFDPGDMASAPPEQQVLDALRRTALPAAERMILRYYGLHGDGVDFSIFTDATGPAGVAAYAAQVGNKMELHVNMSVFSSFAYPNGGTLGNIDFDRVITHEMTHAVMDRTVNMAALPSWFKEGTAEFIHGAEDRLSNDLAAVDGNSANGWSAADVTALVNNGWDSASPLGGSAQYSAAFAAVKYLNDTLVASGSSMTRFMDALRGPTATLDTALADTGLWANEAGFVAGFKTAGVGDAFINGLDLTDFDLGGIAGGSATSAVEDLYADPEHALSYFHVVWPGNVQPDGALGIQAGANNSASERIGLNSAIVSSATLGVDHLDVVNKAGAAMDAVDRAVERVASARTAIGATMNRLEYSMRVLSIGAENHTASDSRIRDADVAETLSSYLKVQLLQSTGLATLSQANVQPQNVLGLLR